MKTYLGDGVYVAVVDYGLVLTTEDGISATNTIYLEPEVLAHFLEYVRTIQHQPAPSSTTEAQGLCADDSE